MARAIQFSRRRGRFAYCRMSLAQEATLRTVSLGVGGSVGSARRLVWRELNDSMSEYESLDRCGKLWYTVVNPKYDHTSLLTNLREAKDAQTPSRLSGR